MSAVVGRRMGQIAVALVVAAVILWALRKPDPDPLAAEVEVGRDVASWARGAEASADAIALDPLVARSTAVPSTCILHLRVLKESSPARGRVSWLQSVHCQDVMAGLSSSLLPGSRDDAGVQHADVDGQVDLELRTREWMWLRFVQTDGSITLDRVGPLVGDATHTLALPGEPRLHLQVIGPDWLTPVPHARVEVHTGALVEPLGGRSTWETDGGGYLCVAELPPGRVIVTTEGADVGEGPPAVCSLVWGRSPADVSVLLVQSGPRCELRLNAFVEAGAVAGPPPKLFLVRRDCIRERLHPQQGTLVSGQQELVFSVPAGTYEVGVLPVDELRVEGRLIEVTGAVCRAAVALSAAKERTELLLRGVGFSDPPLRVNLESAHGVRSDDPDLLFVGPFHWQGARASVPRSAEPRIVTCLGRHRAFVSARPVVLNAASVDVEMVPASCLAVEWVMRGQSSPTAPVLVATLGEQQVARPFERSLADCAGGRRPALAARVVVPFGAYRLEAVDGERVLWTRHLTANARHHALRIDDRTP